MCGLSHLRLRGLEIVFLCYRICACVPEPGADGLGIMNKCAYFQSVNCTNETNACVRVHGWGSLTLEMMQRKCMLTYTAAGCY